MSEMRLEARTRRMTELFHKIKKMSSVSYFEFASCFEYDFQWNELASLLAIGEVDYV